jgi:transposase
MSRSISCQMPRRTLLPPGGNAHPSVELISRDRGTTEASGATRGAPQALQIADRWHILHNLGEALEKVLARHHTDLKRASTPAEEEKQVIAALDQQALAHVMARSQAEQLRQARRERRLATFTRVQELSAQGWSGASIARMLGIHKKTAVKYAAAEHFPEARSDRGHKLAPYLPFLHMQWAAGEDNIAALYQAIRAPSIRWLGNRCAQLPDGVARGHRTQEATTKILPTGFQGEQTSPTPRPFEPSCNLVSSAKAGELLRARPAHPRPRKASPSSGEGSM